jgi:serine/threonine protein phosphatase PrpC
VSELASNLVRHAQGGTLTVEKVNRNGRPGISIESVDHGPGITDVEQAMTDGFSTAGGLGCGLGAVNRLMDRFDITSQQGVNPRTRIMCSRWIRPAVGARLCPLQFGVATRPCLNMAVNGDAFVIKHWDTGALVGVIDGVGHGQFAYRAAQTARQYVETHFDQSLEEIFRGVARTCRATRGVVMALSRFEFASDGTRYCFASVGNIESRVFGVGDRAYLIARRGILGGAARAARQTEHCWQTGSVMVLHSDGVSSHWDAESFSRLRKQSSAGAMAEHLLRMSGKPDDDATVVVVKDRSE